MRRVTATARRRTPPSWVRPTIRAGIAAAVLLSVGGATFALDRAGVLDVVGVGLARMRDAALVRMGLEVERVLVAGVERTPADQVALALGVARGEPILSFAPEEARARLEKLPWVKSATVERSLPDTIRVRVVERRPLAIWQQDGRLRLIDADGQPIRVSDLRAFHALPIVVGPDAAERAPALIAQLALFPALAGRVTAAQRIAERRWTIRIDNRVDIRLPAQGIGRALARLDAMQRQHELLDRDIVAVDMRVPDRLFVELAPGAVLQRNRPPERAS